MAIVVAEKQADGLKYELAGLERLLAQERTRTYLLEGAVDATRQEKDEAQSAREVAVNKAIDLEAANGTLKGALTLERARADAQHAATVAAIQQSGLAGKARAVAETEVADLKETLAQERTRAFQLQTAADEMHARECANLYAQIEALRDSAVKEREGLKQECHRIATLLVDKHLAFDAERRNAQKAIIEHRKVIAQQLDSLALLLQPNPFTAECPPTTLTSPLGSYPSFRRARGVERPIAASGECELSRGFRQAPQNGEYRKRPCTRSSSQLPEAVTSATASTISSPPRARHPMSPAKARA
ncbi:hypothetical protein DFH08DRAFT_977993 [Mycena albidolilacea]|uniref:Uncharacterized protein n=1 Tax=Mycena albidolilacea TaxID=1033008 RepID=A0AAD7E7Z4_9AGAR|nr:hypothetical protein DFH08DRAFT_977993 [Mycena albidolilacea]